MKNIFKKTIICLSIISIFSVNSIVGAIPNNRKNISHRGAYTISSDLNISNGIYQSENSRENALLVNGGNSTIDSINVIKSGDSSTEDDDFYGTNAGVLVYNGILNINGGEITTNASHANAIFSYGNGIVNIKNTTIKTESNNSGGVMVAGGGTISATNLNVLTNGNSSASIRSDRGGGTLIVNSGSYKTTGVGSPAIYSTANVEVNNATLESTASEGVIVEGNNSVTLNKVKLIDTNTTLNGNSETYKNIFLYQSMSEDANVGTSSFNANDSTIITYNGDTFYVTNTTCEINLNNNTFTNSNGNFLRVESAKWGNSGSNGGIVSLNLTKQIVNGDIIVDNISTLDLKINDNSKFVGLINKNNDAKNIDLTLDETSTISLTGDSYVNSLTNELEDNSNIYLNGYKLYVDGKETSANNSTSKTNEQIENQNINTNTDVSKDKTNNNLITIIIIVVLSILIIIISIILIKQRKERYL